MTSCTIILHSTVQKQLHNFDPSSWQDDLSQARICLSTLSFCGSLDPVARKFLDKLEPILASIAAYRPSRPPSASAETNPAYLLTIPRPARESPHVTLSLTLLSMLCQPFSDTATKAPAEELLESGWRSDPARFEHAHLIERLEWDFENSLPFQWNVKDLTGFGIPALADRPFVAGKFLGQCSEPSGWAGTPECGHRDTPGQRPAEEHE
jgi:hypothetical protein